MLLPRFVKVNRNSTHCYRLLTITFVIELSCDIPSPTGEPVPGQLPQTTITAIIVASVIVLLLVLLLFVMIVILIYTCILKRNEKRYAKTILDVFIIILQIFNQC